MQNKVALIYANPGEKEKQIICADQLWTKIAMIAWLQE